MANQLTVPATDIGELGPAMRALNVRQRLFVEALLMQGNADQHRAAAAAGYTGTDEVLRSTGSRLARDDKVRAAIHEESIRRMESAAILATSVLVEIAGDSMHKDRLKASLAILDRVGLHATTEHKVTVKKEDDADKIRAICLLADKLGLDKKILLGQAGVVIDAEFVDISPGSKAYIEAELWVGE
jgi:hypothetical protein